MNRRNFITRAGIVAAAGSLAPGLGLLNTAFGHDHGGGVGTDPHQPVPGKNPLLDQIVITTTDCIQKGELCVAHCIETFNKGTTSMAECNTTVHNMLAACNAMLKLASYQTADMAALKSIAAGCAELCRACKEACDVHAHHHASCKACSEACEKCMQACASL